MENASYSFVNLGSIKGFNDILCEQNIDGSCSSSNILKLNKIDCRTENNQKYKIIKYDKSILNNDLINSYGLCRSVIINSNNCVVGFAPPKSLKPDTFFQKYPEKNDDIIAEEFVEGTMINVFFDPTIGLTGGWEISTKSTIGATSSFFKRKEGKNFRNMFLEASQRNNLILENLNRNLCYSFVLQHPENRIVVPFSKPQLYLVAIYLIDNSDKNNIKVYRNDMNKVKNSDWLGATIKFPEIYEWNNYTDLIEKYASMNTSYDKVGFVLHNKKTGERTKVRNPTYEEVRQLRGNQPKLQFQYLTLRKEGKVSEFLKFYPENKNELSMFRDQIHLFTITLYDNYVSCYIKKEKPLKEYSPQFKTHMYNIHQIYLNELKEQKKHITLSSVINYVNNLEPTLLMFSLNYNFRQHDIDIMTTANVV
jgi:hypothetical protein